MKDKPVNKLEYPFLFLVILLGGWLRFAPTLLSGGVINDGGMFFSMSQAVRANHFNLPYTVTYNGLNVPFAYPALPFYLTALLSDSFGWSLIELFRWLPAVLSTLSILAFFLLARNLLKPSSTALLGTAAFAFLPRAYTWFVMGGGVSRGLGQLFLLLTLWGTYQAFTHRQVKYIILTVFFGALAVVSHPGQLLHTVILCACFWLYLNWKDVPRVLLLSFGVAALSAPWWLTVMLRHGFSPFLSASQTGGFNGLFWLPLIFPTFAEEYFLTVFTIFGVLGLVVQVLRREFLLLLFLILPFLVDPRSASSVAIVPLAMLAGVGLNDLVLPGVARLSTRVQDGSGAISKGDWLELSARHHSVRWLLIYFLFVSLLGAYAYDQPLSRTVLPGDSLEAMLWVRDNSPSASRFLLLTGVRDPFGDPVREWFPVYAERVSVNTVQGLEWILGGNFLGYASKLNTLQGCMNAGLDCLARQSSGLGIEFEYLYLLKAPVSAGAGDDRNPALLAYQLEQSSMYAKVYENKDVIIFFVQGPR
jgi:hypothetical protein